MSTPFSEKYNAALKVAQISGSCGIEGINVSESTKKQMTWIIEGTLSASDAKKAILSSVP
jgi:hypothetical protein